MSKSERTAAESAAPGSPATSAEIARFDVIVVGAGFGGLYMLHKLRGMGLKAHAYEMGGDVGGTWYWNGYPGARCDVESLSYSYSFSAEIEQEWEWSERYAAQPEIQRYIAHVADRLDLRRDISFNTRVNGASYDARSNLWNVALAGGRRAQAPIFITAVGCHSTQNAPKIPGKDRFKGKVYYTSTWTHGKQDFSNQRVGVIGTGSSGIQTITEVAKNVGRLTVFQRTPNFSLPAQNRKLPPETVAKVKGNYAWLREMTRLNKMNGAGDVLMTLEERAPRAKRAVDLPAEQRETAMEGRWNNGGIVLLSTFADTLTDDETNRVVADFVRAKIRSIVQDPQIAAKLSPTEYPIGAKRVCIDTGYYAVYNQPNVELVDIKEDAIEEITATGVRLRSGRQVELDVLIFATGFDAVTGSLLRLNITGEQGQTLQEYWADGPMTYLGLGIAGFPNLFTITGPLSPSALSHMVVSIEQHVDWIGDCLDYMRNNGFDRIDVDPKFEREWQQFVLDAADGSVQTKTNSWYVGANIPGKPRTILVYTGGTGRYRELCDEVVAAGYKGFHFSRIR